MLDYFDSNTELELVKARIYLMEWNKDGPFEKIKVTSQAGVKEYGNDPNVILNNKMDFRLPNVKEHVTVGKIVGYTQNIYC